MIAAKVGELFKYFQVNKAKFQHFLHFLRLEKFMIIF